MAMPKNITLINKQSKNEKKLTFAHALRLLRLDNKQGRESFVIKGKYEFRNNEIIRESSNKTDTEETE
jgi:hypothetical protein